jgi:putative transposon-encoded protein
MKIREIHGKVVLEELRISKFMPRTVIKNNDTSGKVTVPKDLIGKKVYLVWGD